MIPDRSKDTEMQVFKLLKPILGSKIDAIWRRYQGMLPERRARLLRRLNVLAAELLDMRVGGEEKIYLEPPSASIISGGPYTLGNVVYGKQTGSPFTLYPQELLQHTFVLGPTGTGKTTLLTGILGELLRNNIPFWAVDWKRDTRAMLHHPLGKDIQVFTVGTDTAPLRLNILQPPTGVTMPEWVEKLSDVISEGWLLGPGARKVLKQGMLTALHLKGEHTTLRDAAPAIRAEIHGAKARELQWLQSCERAVDELTTGPFGDSLNATTDAMTIDELLDRNVVFELEGLGIDQGRTLSIYLLQSLLLLRKKQHLPKEILRHMLIFDEAQNIFIKEKQGDPPSIQSQLMREVRAYGEGVIALTQMLENFSNSVKTNSYTTIVLPTSDPWDVKIMSETLQVKPEWISSIPRGHAIVRLRYRHQKPFLISFPEQPIKNMLVPDNKIRELHEQWRGTRAPPAAATPQRPTIQKTGEREVQLLLDIAAHPISTVTQRYERLKWNPRTGTAVQASILQHGLAEFVLVTIGQGPRGRMKFLTLTEQGAAIVTAAGGTVRPSGPAGMEHEFWRSRLKDRCEQHNYTVTEEFHLGDRKRADLHAHRKDRVILIEVETGNSDVQGNITKCQGHELVLFFTNQHAYETERHRIPHNVSILTPDTINEIHNILD
jgi:hypothetical protein